MIVILLVLSLVYNTRLSSILYLLSSLFFQTHDNGTTMAQPYGLPIIKTEEGTDYYLSISYA